MKYRIVIRNSKSFPYGVECKKTDSWFCRWEEIAIADKITDAEKKIKLHFDNRNIIPIKKRVGEIVKEISEEDILVLKLQDRY